MKNIITIMLTSGSYHAHCPLTQLGFYSPEEIEFVRFDGEQYLTREEIAELCTKFREELIEDCVEEHEEWKRRRIAERNEY